MKSNLIDFISKENDKKLLTNKEKALLRARKEVNIKAMELLAIN